MKRVLFVCAHNASRSQMAEAFFNHLAKNKAMGFSAGTKPAAKLSPIAIEVMKEAGIDIGDHRPKLLTPQMLEYADMVINMGCGIEEGVCPVNFVPDEDWHIESTVGKPIELVRSVRNQIKTNVVMLIRKLQDEFNAVLTSP